MREAKEIPPWALVISVLLFANLALMSWVLFLRTHQNAATKQFNLQVLHTNDVSPWPYLSGENATGVGIVDVKTGKPVWVKWDLPGGGNLDIQSFFFRGEHVFDLYWTNNHPPVFGVRFKGSETGFSWWVNRGGANTFNERVFYTNGGLARDEIWYGQAWRPLEKRDEKHGVVVNGQWRQVTFDTNGIWSLIQ